MRHAQFFTATILNWNYLLQEDCYKDIIIAALQHRVRLKQVRIYGFVIMPNHIHLLWLINPEIEVSDFQRDLMKYTAKEMIRLLKADKNETALERHTVGAKDRVIQIWERNSLSIDVFSLKVFNQKLTYIHNNPLQLKWQLVEDDPTKYIYSSAAFYEFGKDDFGMLTSFMDDYYE